MEQLEEYTLLKMRDDCCEMICDKDANGAYINCDPTAGVHDYTTVCRNP